MPTDDALQAVLHKIITRTTQAAHPSGDVGRRGRFDRLADDNSDSDEARALRPLQAAACTYRIAIGPRAGQKVLTRQGVIPRQTDFNAAARSTQSAVCPSGGGALSLRSDTHNDAPAA